MNQIAWELKRLERPDIFLGIDQRASCLAYRLQNIVSTNGECDIPNAIPFNRQAYCDAELCICVEKAALVDEKDEYGSSWQRCPTAAKVYSRAHVWNYSEPFPLWSQPQSLILPQYQQILDFWQQILPARFISKSKKLAEAKELERRFRRAAWRLFSCHVRKLNLILSIPSLAYCSRDWILASHWWKYLIRSPQISPPLVVVALRCFVQPGAVFNCRSAKLFGESSIELKTKRIKLQLAKQCCRRFHESWKTRSKFAHLPSALMTLKFYRNLETESSFFTRLSKWVLLGTSYLLYVQGGWELQ